MTTDATNLTDTTATHDAEQAADETPSLIEQERARRKQASAWLKRAVAPETRLIRAAAGCGIGAGLAIIGQCFLVALLIHRFVIEKISLSDASLLLAGLAATIAARAGFVYAQERLGIAAAHRTEARLRDDLLTRINTGGPSLIHKHQAGALVAQATDHITALESYVARYLPQSLIAAGVPIAILAVTFPVNWVVGTVFLIAGPLAPFFMALVGIGAAGAAARQHETLARMGGHFLDRLRGLTTLKLFGQAKAEADGIERVAETLRIRTMKVLRIAFLSSTVLEFFSMAAIAIVAVYVGMGLLGFMDFGPAKNISLFNALFVLLLAPEFFQPLRQLGALYHDRASAIGAAQHLMGLIDASGADTAMSAIHVSTTAGGGRAERDQKKSPPSIRFQNVSLSFEGGRTALRDVSFTVEAGTSLALMGPSGSGKSSTIKLLLGFEVSTGGTITLDGTPITDTPLEDLRASIAWAGQNPHLFHDTLAGNIALGDPSPERSRIEEAARRAHLDLDLDRMIGERNFGLSGGQAQRVALARAFYRNAPIVLLDEPTASLDAENEALIIETIKDLAKDRTVILATHSDKAAALCDRVLRIENGRLTQMQEALA